MSILKIPTTGPLEDVFDELPSGVRRYLKSGFGVLASLAPNSSQRILSAVLHAFDSDYSMETPELAKALEIDEDDAKPLLFAVSILVTSMSSRNESPEKFVEIAEKAEVLDDHSREAVLSLARAVKKQAASVRNTLERARLGAHVLPSLETFDVAVELRLSFDQEQVERAVPIAVVHIDTDALDQIVWLQLTKRQVEHLIDKLRNVHKQMELAEQFASRCVSSE